jgi:hypothetical protein
LEELSIPFCKRSHLTVPLGEVRTMIAEKANLRLNVCSTASSVCTMTVTRESSKGRKFHSPSVLPSWSYYEARVNVYLQLRIMLVEQFLVHLKYAVHYGIANACQSGLKSLKII